MRFGFTPEEWSALTPAQRAFLRKAHEERTVEVGEMLAAAVATGVGNAMRKKGKKAQKLFRKRKAKRSGRKMARGEALGKMRRIQEAESKRKTE